MQNKLRIISRHTKLQKLCQYFLSFSTLKATITSCSKQATPVLYCLAARTVAEHLQFGEKMYLQQQLHSLPVHNTQRSLWYPASYACRNIASGKKANLPEHSFHSQLLTSKTCNDFREGSASILGATGGGRPILPSKLAC